MATAADKRTLLFTNKMDSSGKDIIQILFSIDNGFKPYKHYLATVFDTL